MWPIRRKRRILVIPDISDKQVKRVRNELNNTKGDGVVFNRDCYVIEF